MKHLQDPDDKTNDDNAPDHFIDGRNVGSHVTTDQKPDGTCKCDEEKRCEDHLPLTFP